MVKQTLNFENNNKYDAIAMEQYFMKAMKYSFLLLFIFGPALMYGQVDLDSGVTALEEAGEGIEGYFAPIETIVYIIAGIMALIGVIQVFTKWQMGDPGVMSTAVSWLASVIFLIVAITLVKSFFGIG